MKNYLSFWFVPLLFLLVGCSTRVSTHHRHHNHEYRHHNHVSVGVHGRASGAGVLGALIVGGIIGSIIHDQQHQHEEDIAQQDDLIEPQTTTEAGELANGYPLEENPSHQNTQATNGSQASTESSDKEFQQVKQQQSKSIEWHQVGKDGQCYLMGVSNGVTDVIAAVPESNCQP